MAIGLGGLLAALHAGRVFLLRASPSVAFFASSLFLVAMALCIFVSTRLMRRTPHSSAGMTPRSVGVGVVLALSRVRGHIVDGRFQARVPSPHSAWIWGWLCILLYCSAVFLFSGHRRGSLAFQVLAVALACGRVLMGVGQLENPFMRDIRQRTAPIWSGAADAAGHRHGDGAV